MGTRFVSDLMHCIPRAFDWPSGYSAINLIQTSCQLLLQNSLIMGTRFVSDLLHCIPWAFDWPSGYSAINLIQTSCQLLLSDQLIILLYNLPQTGNSLRQGSTTQTVNHPSGESEIKKWRASLMLQLPALALTHSKIRRGLDRQRQRHLAGCAGYTRKQKHYSIAASFTSLPTRSDSKGSTVNCPSGESVKIKSVFYTSVPPSLLPA